MMTLADSQIALPLMGKIDDDGNYAPDSSSKGEHSINGGGHSVIKKIRELGFNHEPKIPQEPLLPGEQYRFHFNAGLCIGCQCCVVACNEQNNNPATVNWRRVGEIEGGIFPATKRHYLSMGCNHCVDPSCLEGCPTDAYVKDVITGIVRHEADACIGCQYCIWNCPYGVPQYNPERNIVTKCDMCYSRLEEGDEPACVFACPEQAIMIEKVSIDAWRADHSAADAPGMPDSSQTISTTRITLPPLLADDTVRVNRHRLEPEDPHTPLIFLLTLTQLSVGGFIALWLSEILSPLFPSFAPAGNHSAVIALGMLFVAVLALNASIFHLGRPIHAYKALKMWRRSWLSREVLLFGLFSGFASLYAGLWLDRSTTRFFVGSISNGALTLLGAFVVVSGLAGILSSARIYMVPARPAWNTPRTMLRFLMTAFILGPLFAEVLVLGCSLAWPNSETGAGQARLGHYGYPMMLAGIVVAASFTQLFSLFGSVLDLVKEDVDELKDTALLLTRRFRKLFLTRLVMLTVGGLIIPTIVVYSLDGASSGELTAVFAVSLMGFALALAGEFIGRYLFFVTVVPKNIAGAFFRA